VALAVGVVLLVAAGAVVSIGTDRLRARLDHDLHDELAVALADVASGTAPGAVAGSGNDDLVVQVLQSFGAVVAASPGIDRIMISVNGPFDGTVVETKRLEVDDRTGDYRVTWGAVPPSADVRSGSVVVVGLPLAATDRSVAALQTVALAVAAVLTAAAGLTTWAISRRRVARLESAAPPPADDDEGALGSQVWRQLMRSYCGFSDTTCGAKVLRRVRAGPSTSTSGRPCWIARLSHTTRSPSRHWWTMDRAGS
jgi:hypothetical protein